MKTQVLGAALIAALGGQGTAFAANDEAQQSIEFSGLVEVELGSSDGDTDITVATAELGITGNINEKVSAEVVLLHEEDEPASDFSVDTAIISMAATEQLTVIVGQTVVPFGVFETNMISDPLTLELAETGATAIQADYAMGNMSASFYLFNGAQLEDDIDNFGFSFSYNTDTFAVGGGLISNMGDTDSIAATIIDDEVTGISINGRYTISNITILGEYITALSDFQAGDGDFNTDAQPSALQMEAAFAMDFATIAVGTQLTDEAEDLGLSESRILAAISREVMDNTSLALEVARDEDYAGDSVNTLTVQLAVVF